MRISDRHILVLAIIGCIGVLISAILLVPWIALCFALLSLFALYTLFTRRSVALQNKKHETERLERNLSHEKSQHMESKARYALDCSALEEEYAERIQQIRSTLSHEMRMPISIILGYAELITEGMIENPAVQAEYMDKILKRSRDLNDIMAKKLLGVSELMQQAISPRYLDILSLAEQISTDMEQTAASYGIRIQVLSSMSACLVSADRQQLNKIFFNLIENAIKYMGRDGLITIRLIERVDCVEVSVKDDGLGLPSEETARIFEQGYQGSNQVAGRGHGHGLYLVQSAVNGLGGRIWAQSELGYGMCISFTVPKSALGDAALPEETVHKISLDKPRESSVPRPSEAELMAPPPTTEELLAADLSPDEISTLESLDHSLIVETGDTAAS